MLDYEKQHSLIALLELHSNTIYFDQLVAPSCLIRKAPARTDLDLNPFDI